MKGQLQEPEQVLEPERGLQQQEPVQEQQRGLQLQAHLVHKLYFC